MHKRTAHRWRLGASLLIAALLALGSYWLVLVMNRADLDIRAAQKGNAPDYFVDNFSVVRMGPDGRPAYIVSGVRLTHYPLDDSSDIDTPFVRKLTPGQPPMDVHALRARIDQDKSRVRLNGRVLVTRAAAPGVQNMDLKTEALTLFPDTDKMETDQAVEMLLGSTHMSGVGMEADNAARQVHIAHQLRLTRPPAPR